MTLHTLPGNIAEWDRRSANQGLHAVFSQRWSDDECQAIDVAQQDMIFSALPDINGRVVLDLGCGIGRITRTITKRGGRAIGLDTSLGMLKRARSAMNDTTVLLMQASAGHLPLGTGAIDVVIASYVLQHILDDAVFALVIQELARVLNPGGLAVMIDGIGEHHHYPANSIVTVIRTWKEYAQLLKPHFRLLVRRPTRFAEDEYTFILWERT